MTPFPAFITEHPHFLIFRDSLVGALILRSLAYRPRFDGRANRTELLVTWLVCALLSGLATMLLSSQGVVAALFPARLSEPFVSGMPITIALICLPIIAAMVRRFHDTSRTAWAFFTIGFPYIGILIFLGLLFWDGDENDNAFGPNPRPHS